MIEIDFVKVLTQT